MQTFRSADVHGNRANAADTHLVGRDVVQFDPAVLPGDNRVSARTPSVSVRSASPATGRAHRTPASTRVVSGSGATALPTDEEAEEKRRERIELIGRRAT